MPALEERRRALASLPAARRRRPVYVAAAFILLLALLLDVWMGEADVAVYITPKVVLQVLAHHVPGLGARVTPPANIPYADNIVWQGRLPRALAGALIGMLLAMAGVAFQSLLMNPLADPYTVGVASGSALGSMGIILLGGMAWMHGFAQPLAAFVCGLAAVSIVYLLARVGGRISAQTFLLSGTIVGTFFWSLIPLIVTIGNRSGPQTQRASDILMTLFGSLERVSWHDVGLLLPFGLAGMVLLWRSAPELDLMALGEESASHLGVDAESFKRRVIVAGSLMTAAAVAVAGIIAFVGFVVPHLARRLVGPRHYALLPASMLLGAAMLVLADWLSRVYLFNIEIGVITSLFGVPVFCAMLRRRINQR